MAQIKDSLPLVQENVSLKEHTTFRIGGPAKYFFEANTKEDLIGAVKIAKKMKLSFFILGKGSNLLVSDKGFNGLAIKIKNEKLKIKNYNSKFKIFCESGAPLTNLVSKSLQIGASGFEWATGIPGTIGGAIRGNAGAFGGSIKDILKEVEVYNAKNMKINNFENKDCNFEYRDSIFKHKKDLIILSATLQLKKGDKKEIQKRMKEYLNYRKRTQPLNFPSAGSVFKNPQGFLAGELIEKCGLKEKTIGKAQISKKHANFIVNLGNGKAKDVIRLIKLIKTEVKNKFNIGLEEEIQYFGFNF